MLSELVVPRSRLSADYTALDQQVTSFTPIDNFKITNQKNKFQPENEVRFKYLNERHFSIYFHERTTNSITLTRTSVQIFGESRFRIILAQMATRAIFSIVQTQFNKY